MKWPEEINEGFPPPLDGEPPALRRDIADELADHLACAVERELAQNPENPAEARQAALARFGESPARLARRLWFEAMKERIMRDRIISAAFVALAAAGIFIAVFAWQALRQSQQTNQAMLAALQKLATRENQEKAAPASNLATLKIRFRGESTNKPPVIDITADLSGNPFGDPGMHNLSEKMDKEGNIIFGPMQPGQYSVHLHACDRALSHNASFTIYGGRTREETFIVPGVAPVIMESNMPEDLKKLNPFIGFDFYARTDMSDGKTWEFNKAIGHAEDGKFYIYSGNRKGLVRALVPSREPLNFPALNYKLLQISVGFDPYQLSQDDQIRYRRVFFHEEDPEFKKALEKAPVFKAVADRENHWQIKIPEPLINQMRQELNNTTRTSMLSTDKAVEPPL